MRGLNSNLILICFSPSWISFQLYCNVYRSYVRIDMSCQDPSQDLIICFLSMTPESFEISPACIILHHNASMKFRLFHFFRHIWKLPRNIRCCGIYILKNHNRISRDSGFITHERKWINGTQTICPKTIFFFCWDRNHHGDWIFLLLRIDPISPSLFLTRKSSHLPKRKQNLFPTTIPQNDFSNPNIPTVFCFCDFAL